MCWAKLDRDTWDFPGRSQAVLRKIDEVSFPLEDADCLGLVIINFSSLKTYNPGP